jgi:CheY-like chemotaxis protein
MMPAFAGNWIWTLTCNGSATWNRKQRAMSLGLGCFELENAGSVHSVSQEDSTTPQPGASCDGTQGDTVVPRAESTGTKGGRILLVEDHEDSAKIMVRLLGANGYQVSSAGTVADALNLARQQPFDLVISDLGLPDRSGLDLMRELKSDRAIPAIALSGYALDDDVAKCIEAGFSEHITKPVNFQSLLNAISRLLA